MRNSIILLSLLTILCFGCKENMAPETGDQNNEGKAGCTPLYPEMDITYDNFVKGVVTKYCAQCHYGGNSPGPGNFTTYSGITVYADFFSVRVISDNADMPQGNAPLQKSIRDSLNIWINNCIPEN